MGILSAIGGRRVYLDANIFIYWLENHANYLAPLTELFQALDNGLIQAVTSELTLAEVLIKPFLDRNISRQQAYQRTLTDSTSLTVIPISRSVLIEAARVRATTRLLLADSIHLATAQANGCDAILTNDQRLHQLSPLKVVFLTDFAPAR